MVWKNPYDPDAQITKMKDGHHLAHKAENMQDLKLARLLANLAGGLAGRRHQIRRLKR